MRMSGLPLSKSLRPLPLPPRPSLLLRPPEHARQTACKTLCAAASEPADAPWNSITTPPRTAHTFGLYRWWRTADLLDKLLALLSRKLGPPRKEPLAPLGQNPFHSALLLQQTRHASNNALTVAACERLRLHCNPLLLPYLLDTSKDSPPCPCCKTRGSTGPLPAHTRSCGKRP